jgi:hypothetical protein
MIALKVIPAVNWSLFFLALAACGVAAAWVGYVAYGLARRLLDIQRQLTPYLEGLAQRADTAMRHADTAAENFAQIETAALHLEASIGRLAVLVGAFSEVNRRWKRFTGFVS